MKEPKEKTKKEDNEWRLDDFRMEYNSWGEKQGTYTTTVRFKNKQFEQFQIILDPEDSKKFLELIREKVRETADNISKKLDI